MNVERSKERLDLKERWLDAVENVIRTAGMCGKCIVGTIVSNGGFRT